MTTIARVALPASAADNLRGALLMLLSTVFFVIAMSLVKFLGQDLPVAMQVFARSVFFLLVLLPWILRDPVAAFRTQQPGLFLSRGLATTGSNLLAYYSYQQLPLAEANALSFSRALWLVPLAVVMLGERVRLPRLLATVAGFGGVLLVLDPGGGPALEHLPAAAGLGGAMLLAFSTTGIKALSRNHGQLALLAWAAVLGVLFTLPAAIPVWQLPNAHDALLLLAMSAAAVCSQFFAIRGLTLGDATVVAPVDYVRIITSALFGWVFFHEVPPPTTWAGAAVIIASTLYITWHASRPLLAAEAESVDIPSR